MFATKCGGVLLTAQCANVNLIHSTAELLALINNIPNMKQGGTVFPWSIKGGDRPKANIEWKQLHSPYLLRVSNLEGNDMGRRGIKVPTNFAPWGI